MVASVRSRARRVDPSFLPLWAIPFPSWHGRPGGSTGCGSARPRGDSVGTSHRAAPGPSTARSRGALLPRLSGLSPQEGLVSPPHFWRCPGSAWDLLEWDRGRAGDGVHSEGTFPSLADELESETFPVGALEPRVSMFRASCLCVYQLFLETLFLIPLRRAGLPAPGRERGTPSPLSCPDCNLRSALGLCTSGPYLLGGSPRPWRSSPGRGTCSLALCGSGCCKQRALPARNARHCAGVGGRAASSRSQLPGSAASGVARLPLENTRLFPVTCL